MLSECGYAGRFQLLFGVILLSSLVLLLRLFVGTSVSTTARHPPRFAPHPSKLRKPKEEEPEIEQFSSLMNDEEKEESYRMLNFLTRKLRSVNVDVILYSGSLLGAYRYSRMLPWDDDIDVLVAANDKQPILEAFSQRNDSQYFLSNTSGSRWKMFSTGNSSSFIPSRSWRFPYIDISFYRNHFRFIIDVAKDARRHFRFPYDHVFPLRRGAFGSAETWLPRNTRAVLRKTYSLDTCTTRAWNHRTESRASGPRHSVRCCHLHRMYSFVSPCRSGSDQKPE